MMNKKIDEYPVTTPKATFAPHFHMTANYDDADIY